MREGLDQGLAITGVGVPDVDDLVGLRPTRLRDLLDGSEQRQRTRRDLREPALRDRDELLRELAQRVSAGAGLEALRRHVLAQLLALREIEAGGQRGGRGARVDVVEQAAHHRRERGDHLERAAIAAADLDELLEASLGEQRRQVQRPVLVGRALAAEPVAQAFSTTLGYNLHSRWSFKGHGTRDSLARTGGRFLIVTAIGLFVVGAVQLHYTRYVVTTNRVLYIKGVLKRTHQWIPWAKVTDLSMEQTIPDRIKNVGSVRIESANEDSQFRKMTNLTNPETMMRVLVYMVSQRQGSVPLPEDIHAILGVPGPDGITHLPRKDDEGGRGEEDDDVVSWGADDDGGGGDDDDGGGGAGGDGSGGGGSGGGGSGGGAGGGDDTVLLTRPRRSPPVTVEGPLAPGTVTVPRPGRGEESRPSRANPVQDVGAPRRRRPEPPATGRGEGSSPADSIGPSDDGARPDTPPPDPGRAALDD